MCAASLDAGQPPLVCLQCNTSGRCSPTQGRHLVVRLQVRRIRLDKLLRWHVPHIPRRHGAQAARAPSQTRAMTGTRTGMDKNCRRRCFWLCLALGFQALHVQYLSLTTLYSDSCCGNSRRTSLEGVRSTSASRAVREEDCVGALSSAAACTSSTHCREYRQEHQLQLSCRQREQQNGCGRSAVLVLHTCLISAMLPKALQGLRRR